MYGKIHQDIYDSSLISQGWLPTYIFMSAVILSDEHGVFTLDEQVWYDRIGFTQGDEKSPTFDQFMDAINVLEEPDPVSNLPNQEGRRLIALAKLDKYEGNRGYLVVNKSYYRERGSAKDKKEYDRQYRAAERAARKSLKNKTVVNSRNESLEVVKVVHTDTDTDKDLNPCPKKDLLDSFDLFWKTYPKKKKKAESQKIWLSIKPDETLTATIMSALKCECASHDWLKENGQYIPLPTSWLRGKRWEDETEDPEVLAAKQYQEAIERSML